MSNPQQRARQRIPGQLTSITERVSAMGQTMEGATDPAKFVQALEKLVSTADGILAQHGTKPAPAEVKARPESDYLYRLAGQATWIPFDSKVDTPELARQELLRENPQMRIKDVIRGNVRIDVSG